MTPYPAYKPTDLPWLPKIPEHWKLVRNKNVLSEQKDIVGEQASQYDLLSLTLSGVILRDMENCKGKFPAEFDSYKIVRPGNIIFCLFDIDETPRGVGLSPHAGMITGAYDVFSINIAEPRFLFYYYLNIDNQKALKPYYTGLRKVVTVSRFLGLQFPVPPPDEQAQIVRYLDSMTAKINKLIRTKKKQIALLQEQKQAIINQAVTKGLDPNAEMKDSGIDWLGKIPKHWVVKEIQRICRLQGGSGFPTEFQGVYTEEIPFIKVNALSSHISPSNLYDTISAQTADLLGARIFHKGDIVFAKVGAALLLQRFELLPFDCCIDNNMMAMFQITENIPWLRYALTLLNFKQFVNPGAVPSISQSQIGALKIPCPPKPEQLEINDYIEKKVGLINRLISHFENEIARIQEYKNSLISSVVTGQVDIRNIPVDDFDPADLVSETEDDSEKEKNIINASEE